MAEGLEKLGLGSHAGSSDLPTCCPLSPVLSHHSEIASARRPAMLPERMPRRQ